MRSLVLASKSPRRKELLGLCNIPFTIDPSQSEEVLDTSLPLPEGIAKLAYEKANEVFVRHPESLVLGSDTIVTIDGKVLGKPKDKEDCRHMMQLLSGRTHQVITGVCFISKEEIYQYAEIADVTFETMTEEEIEEYVSSQEPYDKAGGYALQGQAAIYSKEIKCDPYTIIGLPVHSVYAFLKSKK